MFDKKEMNVMQVIIVDDDPVVREALGKMLSEIAEENGIQEMLVLTAQSAREVLEDIAVYDIYFLDVEMDAMNGIELARRLRQQKIDSPVVFVSSFEKYVWDTFEIGPYAFIRKQYMEEELSRLLPNLIRNVAGLEEEFILKVGSGQVILKPGLIIYAQSIDHYIKITERYPRKKPLMLRGKLGNVEEQLLEFDFIRTHERYLINMNHVVKIIKDGVVLSNGEQLPISRKYKKSVQVALHRWIKSKRGEW